MKKILNLVRKIFLGIQTFLILICSKVLATSFFDPSNFEELYGIQYVKPEPTNTVNPDIKMLILKIVGFIIIPLVFIVGLIIYLRKSSIKKKQKK